MKSVLISDIHFMNRSKYNPLMNEYDGILLPLVNLQLAYDTAKKENCDNVLILGDVIDKSNVSSYLAHKLITFFKDVDIETIIILGNHDISQVDKDFYSFITLLPDINSNIRVISKTEFLTNDIVCVPYSERKDIVTNEMIYDKILLTHIGISECKINESKKIPADFSLQYLRRYVRVITGHYHYPQEVGNVLVVGSPWEIRKDEFEHSEKRIVVYDFDKLKYKSIPSIRNICTKYYSVK
ncbi:MAG: metallophosphoesterase [Nitrososphaerota archaeon]